ncbi:unnamed protein product, partial [Mycena citricolor]
CESVALEASSLISFPFLTLLKACRGTESKGFLDASSWVPK